MKKVNVEEVSEVERKSPKNKFRSSRKNISEALGRDPESLDLLQRHPFDIALVRIPPGAALCPYHLHTSQWELYVVVSGRGDVRDESGTTKIGPGEAFLFKPGEAHSIGNSSQEDFVYYVVANNPHGESCYYPDSQKWLVFGAGGRRIMRGQETDYFDGEE